MRRKLIELLLGEGGVVELAFDPRGATVPAWIKVVEHGGGLVARVAIAAVPGLTVEIDDAEFRAEIRRQGEEQLHSLRVPLESIFQLSGYRGSPPMILFPAPWLESPSRD